MNPSFPHGLKWTALAPLILVSCTLPAREPDFSKVKSVLQGAVNDGAFPGCSAAVGSSKGSYWQGGFGKYAKADWVRCSDAAVARATDVERAMSSGYIYVYRRGLGKA